MKRKVVKQGHNTLTVTLPKKWCDICSIKAGDEIELQERGISLILGMGNEIDLGKIEIDVEGLDRTSIINYIRAVYRRGFEEIKVTFPKDLSFHYRLGKSVKIIDLINKEVSRFIGVEVIHKGNTFAVIKEITKVDSKDFDLILRKIFLIIIECLEDLIQGLKSSDKDLIEGIEEKHDTATKFISYCLRLLNKKGYIDYRKTAPIFFVIESLDMILDSIKYSGRDFKELNQKYAQDCIRLVAIIKENFSLFYQLHYKFSLKTFSKIMETRDVFLKQLPSTKMSLNERIALQKLATIQEILREVSAADTGLQF